MRVFVTLKKENLVLHVRKNRIREIEFSYFNSWKNSPNPSVVDAGKLPCLLIQLTGREVQIRGYLSE
jgi:hypothetical protein